MASRAPLGAAPTGLALREHMNDRMETLFSASVLPLTSIAGTADAVTATCDPALTAGLVAGMKFGITWGAANTGAATLNINALGAVAVRRATGAALSAGDVASGMRSVVEYHDSAFYILSPIIATAAGGGQKIVITETGTWTIPTDLHEGVQMLVRLWAGGGGGHSSGGAGGGGGFMERWLTIGDLGASVTVTIGAGGTEGAVPTAGGNTTFGSHATAYGGGQGDADGGGGGGGSHAVGGVAGVGVPSVGGSIGGGNGTLSSTGGTATTIWGGGAGGSTGSGGDAISGGGGGAAGGGTGGASIFGGNGGNTTVAGGVRGGGGGRNAPGGRGEVHLIIPG